MLNWQFLFIFLDFLKELSSVRMASVNEVPPGHNTNPPVLIHCSEASGRSGVTLASDLLLYTLDHNQVSKLKPREKMTNKLILNLNHHRNWTSPVSLDNYGINVII